MYLLLVLPYYLSWHYGRAFSDIKNIWKNFMIFFYNFFSIPLLFFSLFSPWQRMRDNYSAEFTVENILGTILVNFMMRLVGAVVRSFFIIIGIISIILCLILGFVIVYVWILLPFILIYTLMYGVALLTS
ncbi:MAG: hypothetical protein WAX85_00040 [Minisyncoccia bacterium]